MIMRSSTCIFSGHHRAALGSGRCRKFEFLKRRTHVGAADANMSASRRSAGRRSPLQTSK
ncbi:MAG: hypothetical protein ACLRM8_08580 [Alistipes sp.]